MVTKKKAAKTRATSAKRAKPKARAATKTQSKPKPKPRSKTTAKPAAKPKAPTKLKSKAQAVAPVAAAAAPKAKTETGMSGKYMTKKELEKFEKLLIEERDRIVHGLNSLKGEVLYQPLSDRSTADPNAAADIGTDSFERETALQVVGNESRELYEIEQALLRIKNGTYGICEGTGKPIPKKRLEVFPAARYCVEYQAELEKSGRLDTSYNTNNYYSNYTPPDYEG